MQSLMKIRGFAAVVVPLLVLGSLAGCDSDDDEKAQGQESTTSATGATTTTAPPAPKVLVIDYTTTYLQEGDPAPPERDRVELATDGASFRMTSADGSAESAYDAAAGRAYNWSEARRGLPETADLTQGIATSGPDFRAVNMDPQLEDGAAVRALGRAGDSRVTSITSHGRPAWHYDGPMTGNQLGGVTLGDETLIDDHAVVDVDKATGAVLLRTTSANGRETSRFEATAVTERDSEDWARYRPDPPATAEIRQEDNGFRAATLDEVAAKAGYDVLVPNAVPGGFELDEVLFDATTPLQSGAEGLNPAPTKATSLRWRNPANNAAFGVTLMPSQGSQDWTDPFGREGESLPYDNAKIAIPGRAVLDAWIHATPPVLPRLWGITGNLVVTIDGDLDAAGLKAVAESLRKHTPAAAPSGAPANCPQIGFTPNSDDVAGDITALGTDCAEADRLVRAVTGRRPSSPEGGGRPLPRFFRQDGYTCRGVFNDGPGLANTVYRCDEGTRRITWRKT